MGKACQKGGRGTERVERSEKDRGCENEKVRKDEMRRRERQNARAGR